MLSAILIANMKIFLFYKKYVLLSRLSYECSPYFIAQKTTKLWQKVRHNLHPLLLQGMYVDLMLDQLNTLELISYPHKKGF